MSEARAGGRLLAVAAVAVGFAAADSYVVVMALPDMMAAANVSVDQLHRAAPIISGFLLGYVGVLPLIGRLSDLRGRIPVLVGCLVIFLFGSLVTAAGYDLHSIVTGRVIQGVGAGGLIPPTLALVADLWPADRRGLPLGVISAVQEIGSVVGPLYGAAVVTVADWRAIFLLNAVGATVLAGAILTLGRRSSVRESRLRDLPGVLLLGLAAAAVGLILTQPEPLATGLSTGRIFEPWWGDSRWLTPLGGALVIVVVGFVARELTAERPMLQLRQWRAPAAATDVPGAALLTVALGGLIVTFASAEPEKALVSPAAGWLLPATAVAAGLFVWRQRRAAHPLVPRDALGARPAWGALTVSFFVGVALIAALVDIPLFARLTLYPDSQFDAALVLLRFLIVLPIGAVWGGWLLRRGSPAVIAGAGMLLAAGGFVLMSQWPQDALSTPSATVALVSTGLGFGLALAPVNAALLAHTDAAVHGLASALVVVARMVGMLVGISVLTAVGLWAFTDAVEHLGSVQELCGVPLACQAYTDAVVDAGLDQLRAVFTSAAGAALIAAALSTLLLRPATTVDR